MVKQEDTDEMTDVVVLCDSYLIMILVVTYLLYYSIAPTQQQLFYSNGSTARAKSYVGLASSRA